jgi:uncharacterized protein YmfQ (DUF2313 family)
MDTRKIYAMVDKDEYGDRLLELVEVDCIGTTLATKVDPDIADEMVRRWNAFPGLIAALYDMVTTAKLVDNMMDGDKEKQGSWEEELGRLSVAIDKSVALLKSIKTL